MTPEPPTAEQMAESLARARKRIATNMEARRREMAKAARGGVKHPKGATKAQPDPARRRKRKNQAASRRRNR